MPDPIDIFAWVRIDGRLTSSGQPTDNQLSQLRSLGVTHVINLGPHSHERALPNEAASVSALDMTYIYIPVVFDAPTEKDFAIFCEAMSGLADQKVHVHCIVNARVSAFLYRYRRDVLGLNEAAAREMLNVIWKPGGVWAAFIGDHSSIELPHRPGDRRPA